MTVKNKVDTGTIEESLNKLMVSISFLKATGKSFTSDWTAFPADETELQLDYMIHQIQFLREELKGV